MCGVFHFISSSSLKNKRQGDGVPKCMCEEVKGRNEAVKFPLEGHEGNRKWRETPSSVQLHVYYWSTKARLTLELGHIFWGWMVSSTVTWTQRLGIWPGPLSLCPSREGSGKEQGHLSTSGTVPCLFLEVSEKLPSLGWGEQRARSEMR